MKKIISLITAALILLSSFQFVQADPNRQSDVSEKYKLLLALDIIDEPTVNAEQYLSSPANRGDIVKYSMKIMGYDNNILSANYSEFADVPADSDICRYINEAKKLGYISGKGNGEFGPKDELSYNDAIVIVVSALGAKGIAAEKGGYSAGYLYAAKRLNLKHDSIDNTAAITNADMIKILYAQLFAYTAFDSNAGIEIDTEEYVLEKHLGVKKVSGKVRQAGNILLNSDAGLTDTDGRITVGSTVLYTDEPDLNLLGLYVDAYYKEIKGKNVFLCADTSDNNITVVDSEDFIAFKNNKIEYSEVHKGFEENVQSKKISVDGDADVVLNGRPYISYSQSDINFDGASGYITLIDNDGDNKADVLNIIKVKNYVITGIDHSNKVIYTDNPKSAIDLSDCDYIVCDKDFSVANFGYVQTGNILSVMDSIDGSFKILIPSATKIDTRISEILPDGKVMLENGDEVIFDANVSDKVKDIGLELDRLVTLSYDFQGRVCDISYSDYEHEYWYAYLIRLLDENSGVFNKNYKIRVLRMNNTKETYAIADKLSFDGDRINKADVLDRLTDVDPANNERYTKVQMLRIHTNENGEVNFIDTQVRGTNESNSSLQVDNCYSDKDNNISYNWSNNSRTIQYNGYSVFTGYRKSYFVYAPMPDAEAGLTPSAINDIGDEFYWVFNGNMYDIYDHGSYSDYEIIDPDISGTTPAIVHRQKWRPAPDSSYGIDDAASRYGTYSNTTVMVERVSKVLDADGDEVTKLVCYDSSASGPSVMYIKDSVYAYKRCSENGITVLRPLECGDIVHISYIDDTVIDLKVAVDASKRDNDVFFRRDLTGYNFEVFGAVYAATDRGANVLGTAVANAGNFFEGTSADEVFDLTSQSIAVANMPTDFVIYDADKKVVKTGTLSDIIGMKTDSATPSLMYFRLDNRKASRIFVINNYR